MGGGTSLSSHRAGFGVFWSKTLSKSTAQSAFADSVNCSDNAITTSNAAHSPRNDNTVVSLRATERSVAIAKPIKCDSKRKKAAFTLAEVLITLAIIGIVAALTIPTLIQNYQTKAWNTASQVFQRKLGEALRVMNVQGTLAGYTTTEAFVDELSKHIKITRICENDDITTCFSDTVTWGDEEVDMSKVKKAKNFGQNDWDTNTVAVQFANGVNGIIAYNPSCTQNQFSNDEITINENGIGTTCLAILYDVDGFKNPNTQQKDLRGLNVISLGGSNCAIELSDGTCFTAPFYPTAHVWNACDTNGTTSDPDDLVFMSEHNIQYCLPSAWQQNDYWAGAVKACHDMGSSLPSQEQLDQLARDLYPGTTISSAFNEECNGQRDNDLAMEWNFITSPTLTFWVWSSEERSEDGAYGRLFADGSTYRDSSGRQYSDGHAVCLAE